MLQCIGSVLWASCIGHFYRDPLPLQDPYHLPSRVSMCPGGQYFCPCVLFVLLSKPHDIFHNVLFLVGCGGEHPRRLLTRGCSWPPHSVLHDWLHHWTGSGRVDRCFWRLLPWGTGFSCGVTLQCLPVLLHAGMPTSAMLSQGLTPLPCRHLSVAPLAVTAMRRRKMTDFPPQLLRKLFRIIYWRCFVLFGCC